MADKPQKPEGVNDNQIFRMKEVDRKSMRKIKRDMEDFLLDDEDIEACYMGFRDYIVFTSKRIINVDVQGVSGFKKKYTFLSYGKIQGFEVHTAGLVELDVTVVFAIQGYGKVMFDFASTTDARSLVQLISGHTVK